MVAVQIAASSFCLEKTRQANLKTWLGALEIMDTCQIAHNHIWSLKRFYIETYRGQVFTNLFGVY
jgi:hypothetical protein